MMPCPHRGRLGVKVACLCHLAERVQVSGEPLEACGDLGMIRTVQALVHCQCLLVQVPCACDLPQPAQNKTEQIQAPDDFTMVPEPGSCAGCPISWCPSV